MAKPGRAAWAILAVALVVRIAVVAATPHFTPGADAADYDRHAISIASGHGYPESDLVAGGGPTAFRPPVYPILLAAVYKLPGPNWTEGRLAQALLGTLVVGLIGVLGWQIWNRRTALWAMGVGAVAPPLILLGASLISEPLFLVFELAAIAAVIEHRRSPAGYRWLIAAGALLGLATLTRANGAPFAIPLAVAVWTLQPRLSARSLAAPGVLLATMAVVMAPWVIRNAVELHAFVPVSTQGDFALARNYNELARNDPDLPSAPHTLPEDLAVVQNPDLSEADAAGELGSRARQYMRDHPGYVGATVFRNTVRALQLGGLSLPRSGQAALGIDSGLADVGIYGFYALALLALAGALLPAARRAPWFLWVAPLFALAPALLIAAGRVRYRAPIDPLIVILAALALVWAWDRWFASATPTRSSPAASS